MHTPNLPPPILTFAAGTPELRAAIDRRIEVGAVVVVDDEVLPWMRGQTDAAGADDASTEAAAAQPVAEE